ARSCISPWLRRVAASIEIEGPFCTSFGCSFLREEVERFDLGAWDLPRRLPPLSILGALPGHSSTEATTALEMHSPPPAEDGAVVGCLPSPACLPACAPTQSVLDPTITASAVHARSLTWRIL